MLTLAEPWSPSWRLRGLPDGVRASQLKVDGGRTAWLIEARGDLDLRIERAPSRWPQRIVVVAGASLVAVALVLALRRARRTSAGPLPAVAAA